MGAFLFVWRLSHVTNMITLTTMIKTFKHKGLRAYFETGSTKGIQAAHAKRFTLVLGVLDNATGVFAFILSREIWPVIGPYQLVETGM